VVFLLLDVNKLTMEYTEINKRYSELADSGCCLSCGGAISHSDAKHGEVCVDLGSGRGTDVIRLADIVGSEGFVYGIDISDGMILKSSNTARQLGVTNVAFIRSPLEKINLDDSLADLVISNCTINHASDKQGVWREVFRILNDGGRFVVSDIYSTSPVPEEFRNDPVAIAECWAGSVTRNEYLEQLNNSGFINIRVLEESEPYKKGKIKVSSWTVSGEKPARNITGGCQN
jgi:arsenite methyltransferase